MAEIESTLTHNGVVYTATIVTIEKTQLGREDHGIFQTSLQVGWSGGCGTHLGGVVLDGTPDPDGPLGKNTRTPTAFGFQWIVETIETVCGKYGQWEDLPGKRIFMLHEPIENKYDRAGFNCKGIASLDGQRVMIFAEVVERATEKVDA